jgi:hypothetical protein
MHGYCRDVSSVDACSRICMCFHENGVGRVVANCTGTAVESVGITSVPSCHSDCFAHFVSFFLRVPRTKIRFIRTQEFPSSEYEPVNKTSGSGTGSTQPREYN